MPHIGAFDWNPPHRRVPRIDRFHVLSVLCPPLAVAMGRQWDHLLLNILLTLAFWVPGVVHALWVVRGRHAQPHLDYNADQLVGALRNHLRR